MTPDLHPGSNPASLRRGIARLGFCLFGMLALAAHGGQTSASIRVSVTLIPAPVTVVSDPSNVVVCGTAPSTGDTGCSVITVPPKPATPPGGGSNVPVLPPPSTGSGAGGSVPVVPTVPPVVPPGNSVPPPQVVSPVPGDGGSSPTSPGGFSPAPTLPAARATLELLTLLRARTEQGGQGSARDPFALKDLSPARLEGWRAHSLQVFGTASAARLGNVLGTSAEVRLVRDLTLDYTEMLIGW